MLHSLTETFCSYDECDTLVTHGRWFQPQLCLFFKILNLLHPIVPVDEYEVFKSRRILDEEGFVKMTTVKNFRPLPPIWSGI